jgi:hypothetical protein
MIDESKLWAQFETAKAKRETKYDPTQHESLDLLAVETTEYFKAYSQFLEYCSKEKPKGTSVVGHACGALCSFAVFGDYAFCTATGNLHICDIARCRAKKMFAGSNVCQMTGKIYGVDTQLDLGDRSGSRDQFSNVVESKPTHTKVFGPKKKRVKSKTGTKGRKVSKKTKERKTDQDIMYTGAFTALEKLLKGKKIPQAFSLSFARICVKLYNAVIPFAEKFNRSVVYQLEYHCYVVAYYMAEWGFTSRSVRLLPISEFLQKNIPGMQDLPKLGLDTAKHTQISKQFMLSIKKLPQNDLIMLAGQLESLWPS